MPANYGLSFQPGTDQGGAGRTGQPREAPLQSAIKLLSLRLPSVVGARGVAPQALLQSPGMSGVMHPGLLQLLQQLFSGMGQGAEQGQGQGLSPTGGGLGNLPPGSIPPPHITPGSTPGTPPEAPPPTGYTDWLNREQGLPGSALRNNPLDTSGADIQSMVNAVMSKVPGGGFAGGIERPGGFGGYRSF